MVRRKTVKKNASKRKTNKKNASKRKTNKKNASKRKTNRRKSNKKMVGGAFEPGNSVYVKITKENENENFWVKGTFKKETNGSYEVEVEGGHSIPSTSEDPNIISVNTTDIISVNTTDIISEREFDGIKTAELANDNIILGNIAGKGEWYKGKITTTNTDSTANISYENGTVDVNVGIDRIKPYADVVAATSNNAAADDPPDDPYDTTTVKTDEEKDSDVGEKIAASPGDVETINFTCTRNTIPKNP